MKTAFQRGEKMENLMREIGELQNDYRKLVNGKKLTKEQCVI